MEKLFSKYESPNLRLKNKIVMSPMSRYSSDENGFPSDELINYYISRAKNGVGLIMIEAASIDSTYSKSYMNGLGFYSEEHSDVWKPIVEKIKSYGASVFIQLYHAGRLTTPNVCGSIPISSSALCPMKQRSHLMNLIEGKSYHFQGNDEFVTPKEMDIDQIIDIQNKFVSSCKFACESGFDGIDLHGAHGNLIHQFSNRITNKRTDKYGKDQYLFITELIDKCRNVIPANIVLSLRLSQHMVDFSFIRFSKKDLDFEEIVKRTESKVDVYNCSEVVAGKPMFGNTKTLTEEIRSYTNKTIITSGLNNDVELAETLLNSGGSDLIGFGRLLISNPNLVELIKDKNYNKIVPYNHSFHSNFVF